MKKNIDSLQILRGVAALMVLLFHFTMTLQSVASIDFLNGFFKFGNSGVEIFFVLSGFIISFTAQKLSGGSSVTKYLAKRAIRIYPIYWVIITAFFVPSFLLSLQSSYEYSFTNLASTYLLLPNHLMLNGVSWSLSYELYFYLLFALLIWSRKLYWLMGAILLVCLLRLVGAVGFNSELLDNFFFSPYVLLFFMGVAVFHVIKWERHLPSRGTCAIGMLGCVVSYLVVTQTLHGTVVATILYGLITAVFMFFCINYERDKLLGSPRIFVLLGDASYVLYLFHLPVLNILIKAVARFVDNGDLLVLSASLVLPIITGISIFTHLMVEKPLNMLIKSRLGLSPR